MPVSQFFLSLLLLGLLASEPALAANPPDRACLDKAEQRAAVAAHLAVPLAEVVKRRHVQAQHSELVRARLCRREGRLVYVLTLLGRSGKVVQTTVDAANGEVIGGR